MYANIHSYLDSIFPNPANKTLLLTVLARSLYDVEEERKVLVLKGSGSNGKTVLMKIIASAYPTANISLPKMHSTDELMGAKFGFGFDKYSFLPAESIYNLYYGSHRISNSKEKFEFPGTLIIHANNDIKTDFPRVCTIEFTQKFGESNIDVDVEYLGTQLRELLERY